MGSGAPSQAKAQEGEGAAPDGAAELDGMLLEPGTSLGVANSFDGIPAKARTKTSTKTATTVITQGTANRSLRGGSVPR